MKVALMQPYFLPYIGYWQLIKAVDTFVIYDDIQYIKQGWVNRNRCIVSGKVSYFTLPVSKGSMNDLIKDKTIQPQWFNKEREKFIKSLYQNYGKSQHSNLLDRIVKIISFDSKELSIFLGYIIKEICILLDISTDITHSSLINHNRSLTGENRVIDICKALDAKQYINSIGGIDLYSKEDFKENNIELKFVKSSLIAYKQINYNSFEPFLSILDVLFNCGIEKTKKMLLEFDLV